jgi:hypothetical protein
VSIGDEVVRRLRDLIEEQTPRPVTVCSGKEGKEPCLVVYLATKRKLDIPKVFEGLPVVVQRLPPITPLTRRP